MHDGFEPQSDTYLRNPAPVFKHLQEHAPVFYYPPLSSWVVTRYADIVSSLRDYRTFSSRAVGLIRPPADIEPLVPDLSVEELLISFDPPDHSRHRNVVARGFMATVIQNMEAVIRTAANRIIDGFEQRGAADIMTEYALPLTMDTIVEVLALPPERKEDYRQWSEDLFVFLTPRVLGDAGAIVERAMPEADVRMRWTRLAEANRFLLDHVERCERDPGDDVISAMLQVRDENGTAALDRGAVVRTLLGLIGAGHDTTANMIAHLVQLFSDNPDQRAAVFADPSLYANAVEEGLRIRSSVPGVLRLTKREVTLSGVTIPDNALVYLLIAAAGHDETVFPDSLHFDVRRENASAHLTFGFGRHMCVGNALGRMQARIAISELYRRLPDLAVVDGYQRQYLPLVTAVALQGLDVTWSV